MATIQFRIKGHLENVALVGQAINTICTSVCSASTAYQVELAAVEICNNIIEHAYSKSYGNIDILLKLEGTELSLQFTDSGASMPETAQAPPQLDFDPLNRPDLPEGGMGLYLIETIMDSSDYQRLENKNILTVRKQLRTRQ
ncbi:MAG: ATP-binding protein [Candidatus Kapaibacterium sp.]|nr:MAG: ATP-binding protein [Candidatus Kapabacteria bacterium]